MYKLSDWFVGAKQSTGIAEFENITKQSTGIAEEFENITKQSTGIAEEFENIITRQTLEWAIFINRV